MPSGSATASSTATGEGPAAGTVAVLLCLLGASFTSTACQSMQLNAVRIDCHWSGPIVKLYTMPRMTSGLGDKGMLCKTSDGV